MQEKTHLSRSRVMKILSDLKAGDYIEIDRGILKKINRLPDNY
ncbi:helix-turn-helix domain-containing protein [Enterobacter asburiae]